jgi:hypothetical protein
MCGVGSENGDPLLAKAIFISLKQDLDWVLLVGTG